MKKSIQVVVPMSGFGERFRRAGYNVPKPLIVIDGKPIIGHVIDMFPGETEFIFICNQDHLDEPAYRMRETLESLCPAGRILGIAPHKLGPVHAVLQAAEMLDPLRPVVVNYCDFTCYWDWTRFKKWAEESACDGAIPAYKGFHPHTLGTTNYAYMREADGWVLDIQEKQPYTANRMEEYASSGTYYYAKAATMLEAFRETVAQGLDLNGEYYVSLTYKPMLAAGKRIGVFPLQHFMQWGTPEDVHEYNYWSSAFHGLLRPQVKQVADGAVVVPMAGLGERFRREGYTQTKPLIPVSGKPMVLQATGDLPDARNYVFVLRSDMPGVDSVCKSISEAFPGARLPKVAEVTRGQACTALIGLDELERSARVCGPVTFAACDNGAIYDQARLAALLADETVDVIVWGARGYANALRNPQMFGWIDASSDGVIKGISVKTPLANPAHDPVVLGTFTFRRGADMRRCVDSLIARDGQVNGEYYLDSCINDAVRLGLRCVLFDVDSYLSWGTPNDLKTFNYWQSCFHLWAGHPYSLGADARVEPSAVAVLDEQCRNWQPELPR